MKQFIVFLFLAGSFNEALAMGLNTNEFKKTIMPSELEKQALVTLHSLKSFTYLDKKNAASSSKPVKSSATPSRISCPFKDCPSTFENNGTMKVRSFREHLLAQLKYPFYNCQCGGGLCVGGIKNRSTVQKHHKGEKKDIMFVCNSSGCSQKKFREHADFLDHVFLYHLFEDPEQLRHPKNNN